jgi:hypothetical protein
VVDDMALAYLCKSRMWSAVKRAVMLELDDDGE